MGSRGVWFVFLGENLQEVFELPEGGLGCGFGYSFWKVPEYVLPEGAVAVMMYIPVARVETSTFLPFWMG